VIDNVYQKKISRKSCASCPPLPRRQANGRRVFCFPPIGGQSVFFSLEHPETSGIKENEEVNQSEA